MKNYLTIIVFAVISFCLICGGCQSESELTAAQPSGEKAEPVKAEVKPDAEVKVESAVEPKAEAVVEAEAPTRSPRSRRGGLYGDWQVKVDYNGRQRESILSFSRDEEGKQIGHWISFWGLSELKDVKYEEGKISFVRVRRNREGQSTTSKFTGTVKDGKLSGILSSDRGESKLEGKRSTRISRAVGNWEMKLKMGERQFTSKLVVNADKEGKLTAKWRSQRGNMRLRMLSTSGVN